MDPKQFKDAQRQDWDSVASGWQEWWETIESGAQKVSSRLVELAEVKPNSRVLDIATGIGEPAITAAKKIREGSNGGGHVVATDISSQMLSIARQRAASLGLQDVIEFREVDGENTNLPSSGFDAVICRFGLMFFSDLRLGLANIYRLLVDGGRFAAAVWSSPEKVPFISISMNIVMKETNSQPPPAGTPGPFSLSNEKILEDSFVESGFKDITVEGVNATFNFNSPESYTSFVYETAAPIKAMLANQTQERRQEILKTVTDAVGIYADKETGILMLSNKATCITGKR